MTEDKYRHTLEESKASENHQEAEATHVALTCPYCSEKGKKAHTCPFDEEVNGRKTYCHCCDKCERECAMDI